MTSTIKVDNIQKVSDASNIIKKCSATTTVGSGAGNTVVVCGSTVTIGRCGGTVALASGASQTGFGREGSVDWQTGSIKTTTFTAVSGEGYFVDTSSGGVTVNLPAGTAGAIVAFADYTRTFGNNALTITPNGSNKIGGVAASGSLTVNGQSATFVFVDATEGWINVQETQTSQTGTQQFICATGGTVSTTPTCKIHTFTGPGTFSVAAIAEVCAPTRNNVSYMVVAGGGSGAAAGAGGGGAGGFREFKAPLTPYTASPLDGNPGGTSITVTATSFPIAVGGGGASATSPNPCAAKLGNAGTASTFSTVTSAGGGAGRYDGAGASCGAGGSGGGSGWNSPTASAGNTPSVSPPQGQNGGTVPSPTAGPMRGGGGGGGAGAVGGTTTSNVSGSGGAGVSTEISGSSVQRAGGGGGGGNVTDWSTPKGAGGAGGGGQGGGKGDPAGVSGTAGTANTGGGGGGSCSGNTCATSGAGGSGIVVIRYKFQ